MKPLALSGRARAVGELRDITPGVLRLNEPARPPRSKHDAALIRLPEDVNSALSSSYSAALFIGPPESGSDRFKDAVLLGDEFSHLSPGDIIAVRRGMVRVLYRAQSSHNWLLVTERCNHYCLMCSQPPKKVDDSWILDELHSALSLISSPPLSLGFTGGEPFTETERFIGLVQHARDELPTTAIHVLTNGRAFAKSDTVSQWADLKHPNLCVGIPIYSAVDHIHDYVVQALGAFDETVLGIMKLKNAGQRVEIRVVLNAITTARLEQTCAWIARNIPFVDHVALMGLENTGFAIANDKLLWIDPIDYRESLKRGVQILAAAGVNVSIYNLPLCVIDEQVREYSVKSISDWKNAFPPSCKTCAAKERCAGFFSSGRTRITRGLRPLAA